MRALFILTTLLIAFACKQANTPAETQQEPGANATPDTTAQVNTNVVTSTPLPAEGHDFTFLTHELFHVGGAMVGSAKGKGNNPYEGHWLDFFPDGQYKWGEHKNVLHSGRWSYNDERKILNLQPTSGQGQPSEWKVMHNDQMVVLLGTRTHGNNNTQIQLIRSTTLPD
jgi:hypothetical protein